MPVLITGANGRTSRQVLSTLLSSQNCPALRPLVHTQRARDQLASTFPQLLATPHRIVIADYFDQEALISAFIGISIVFHNGPSFQPAEAAMGKAVIDAALESGARPHFIFCSILRPFHTKLPNHQAKLVIEEYLAESKLDYTIIQPSQYMQDLSLASVYATGILSLPYNPTTIHGFVDLVDISLVVRKVILSPASHNFASYELVGQNVAYSLVVKTLNMIVGREIKYRTISSREFSEKLQADGVVRGDRSADCAERMVLYYDRWGLTGNSNTLQWLLGREATSWEQYLRREIKRRFSHNG